MSAADEVNSNKPRKRKRRPRLKGTGSISKRDGQWVGKITVENFGGPRDVYRYARTKREVKQLLDEIVREVEESPLGFYTPKDGDKYIYFIQDESGGPIKIGIASNPHRRLQEIQIGYPFKLKLLLTIPNASEEIERQLHMQFAPYRLRGEWFRCAPSLRSYIKRHKKQM